ncbi:unnamed protein product [Ectocarpus sp. CCAP 1310/34]|nr:unnamed protein product [Ectocarpus sp. CCAP 1310/34]
MRWSKKGGTGKNENFHGGINRLVAGVARIGVEACDARLLQRVCRHNLDMDRKLGNTSKQSTRWPWRERVVNKAASGILASLPFPKAPPDPKHDVCDANSLLFVCRCQIPTKDLEPMGFEFHTARKAAGRREAMNAATRIVAERRGNNPRSSPSMTAGSAAREGPETAPLPLPTAGGRIGTAAAGAAGPAEGPPADGAAGPGPWPAAGAGAAPGDSPSPSSTQEGRVGTAVPGAGAVLGAGAAPLPTMTTTGAAFANYGGARKLHSKRPTIEGQKSVTPTTDGELDAFARCLATARAQGRGEVMEETARLYNTEFFTQQLDRDAPIILRGPTSAQKLRKKSTTTATAKRARQVSADFAAVQSAGRTASSCSTSPSNSSSTTSRSKRRRDVRPDRENAVARVANRVPLTIEEIETLPDAVAIPYLSDMDQPTSGRVAAKRERLKSYFRNHNLTSYTPVGGANKKAAGAAVTGPPSGHRAI